MRPTLPLALSALISCALLTGCGSGAPSLVKTELVRQTIPPALLRCDDEPEPPAGVISQRDIALFLIDLASAGDDCRGKLAAIGKLVTP